VRTLLLVLIVAACKGSEHKAPPSPPRVSTFEPLPAAAIAVLDPVDAKSEFPKEQPAIAMWAGGGEPPKTTMSVRVWKDGSVRFRCGRRATLPPERVAAMLATFESKGWMPTEANTKMGQKDPEPHCMVTAVQLARDGLTKRHDTGCSGTSPEVLDAVQFVLTVVGPDPCT